MTPTMQDVALRAGVSAKTVSNVVNGYAHVRPETRARVLEAINRTGYQVNTSARNLRQGRTRMIGLALPRMTQPYFAELAASFMEVGEERGLVVIIEQTGGDRDRELDALNGSRRTVTDGLIFSPQALGPDDEPLLPVQTPLVLLGERVFSQRIDHVTMRNVQAAEAATTYLLARGRRRVGLIGDHPDQRSGPWTLRMKGYRQALATAGIPIDPTLIAPPSPWGLAGGSSAMAALLDADARPDAVFCLNDTLAIGAIHTLQLRGLRIPEDVAIIGFDDIEEAQYSTPALTSVHFERTGMAQSALDLLERRIGGGECAPELVEAPYQIEERGST